MIDRANKMIYFTTGLIIGMLAVGMFAYVLSLNSHNGVYEIGFKEQGTVNRFTIYKNRLHLMVALPVTGESSGIIDTRKETTNAKNKSTTLSGTINPKDHKHTGR